METLADTISTINEATLKAIATAQEQVLAFNREVVAALGKVGLITLSTDGAAGPGTRRRSWKAGASSGGCFVHQR